MRKKLLTLGLILTISTVSLTACGDNDANNTGNNNTATSAVSGGQTNANQPQNSLENKYFILEEKSGKVVLTGLTEEGKKQTSLTIPANVDKMATEPFYVKDEKTIFESVTFENPNTELSTRAFNGCKSLKSVKLPANLKEIPVQCFGGTGLESVEIPDSVTKINSNAFITCYNLKSVKIGPNVTEIGSSAFAGDKALESITLPSTVNKIGGQAFNECVLIKEIKIPEGVETLSGTTFIKMNLEKLYLPKSLKKLDVDPNYGWTEDKSKFKIYAYHSTELSEKLLAKYTVEYLD